LQRDQMDLLALRAQMKDLLQRLQQLAAEMPWAGRDEGDHEGPDREVPPPGGLLPVAAGPSHTRLAGSVG
jgi:hypothetical protein